MKKALAFVFISICIIYNIYGQELRLGIVASPGISWFKTDISRISGDGGRVGFNFGLQLDKYFTDHYAFSSGLTLHSAGGVILYQPQKTLQTTEASHLLNPNSRVHYKLQYLQVPISLKFKTTEIGYSTFFAQLGFDAMFNTRARAAVKDQDILWENVRDEINFLYLGYHIGAGIQYKIIGNTSLIGGITYTNGITDVTSDNTERTFMHNVELKIGVLF